MSSGNDKTARAAAPQSDIAAMWEEALEEYNKTCPDAGLRQAGLRYTSALSIMANHADQLDKWFKFRHNGGARDKIRSAMFKTAQLLESSVCQIADTASAAFPPSTAIAFAFSAVLSVAKKVSEDFDMVENFFELMISFLQRVRLLEGKLKDLVILRMSLMKVFEQMMIMSGRVRSYRQDGRFLSAIKGLVDHAKSGTVLADVYKEIHKAVQEMESTVMLQTLRITLDTHQKAEEIMIGLGSVKSVAREGMKRTEENQMILVDVKKRADKGWSDMDSGFARVTARTEEMNMTVLSVGQTIEHKMDYGFTEIHKGITNIGALLMRQKDKAGGGQEKKRRKTAGRSTHFDRLNDLLEIGSIPDIMRRRLREIEHSSAPNVFDWAQKHEGFQDIIGAKNSLFWISGEAGMGKSTASAKIFRYLKEQFDSDPNPSVFVAWYSFRQEYPETCGITSMLKWCAVNVAETDDDYCKATSLELQNRNSYDTWQGYWEQLVETHFLDSPKERRLILIIDGIDELDGNEGVFDDLMDFFERVRDLGTSALQLLITAERSESTEGERLYDFFSEDVILDKNTLASHDDFLKFALHLTSKMSRLERLRTRSRRLVAERVAAKADSFRYIEHAMKRLNLIGYEPFIVKELERLPESTSALYELLLNDCMKNRSDIDRRVLRDLLVWIAYAKSPLSLGEANYLLKIIRQKYSEALQSLGSDLDHLTAGAESNDVEIQGPGIEEELRGPLARVLRISGAANEDEDDNDNESDDAGGHQSASKDAADNGNATVDEPHNMFLHFQERALKKDFCTTRATTAATGGQPIRCGETEAHAIVFGLISRILTLKNDYDPKIMFNDPGRCGSRAVATLTRYAADWWLEHFLNIEPLKSGPEVAQPVLESLYKILSNTNQCLRHLEIVDNYESRSILCEVDWTHQDEDDQDNDQEDEESVQDDAHDDDQEGNQQNDQKDNQKEDQDWSDAESDADFDQESDQESGSNEGKVYLDRKPTFVGELKRPLPWWDVLEIIRLWSQFVEDGQVSFEDQNAGEWFISVRKNSLEVLTLLLRGHMTNWYSASRGTVAYHAFIRAAQAYYMSRDYTKVMKSWREEGKSTKFDENTLDICVETFQEIITGAFPDLQQSIPEWIVGVALAQRYSQYIERDDALKIIETGLKDHGEALSEQKRNTLLLEKGVLLHHLAHKETEAQEKRASMMSKAKEALDEGMKTCYRLAESHGIDDTFREAIAYYATTRVWVAMALEPPEFECAVDCVEEFTKRQIHFFDTCRPRFPEKVILHLVKNRRYEEAMKVFNNLSSIDVASIFSEGPDKLHDAIQQGAKRCGQDQCRRVLQTYSDVTAALNVQEQPNTVGWLYVTAATFAYKVIGDTNEAKKILQGVLKDSHTPVGWLESACELASEIFYEEFRMSKKLRGSAANGKGLDNQQGQSIPGKELEIKQEAFRKLQELRQIMATTLGDNFKLADSPVSVIYAHMLRKLGKAQEFSDVVRSSFNSCAVLLRDDIGGNDWEALRLLAKILRCVGGFEWEAEVAVTLQFYFLNDKKDDDDEDSDDEESDDDDTSSSSDDASPYEQSDFEPYSDESSDEDSDDESGDEEEPENDDASEDELVDGEGPDDETEDDEAGDDEAEDGEAEDNEEPDDKEQDDERPEHKGLGSEKRVEVISTAAQPEQTPTADAKTLEKKPAERQILYSTDESSTPEGKKRLRLIRKVEVLANQLAETDETGGTYRHKEWLVKIAGQSNDTSAMTKRLMGAAATELQTSKKPEDEVIISHDRSARNSDTCLCNDCGKRTQGWKKKGENRYRYLYHCMYCSEIDFCGPCFERRQKRERGDADVEADWRTLCPRGHKHIKAPVKGWRGVREDLLLIGDKEIPFDDWLNDLEKKWNGHWERCWREL